jgi:hypothetical protein
LLTLGFLDFLPAFFTSLSTFKVFVSHGLANMPSGLFFRNSFYRFSPFQKAILPCLCLWSIYASNQVNGI